MATNNAVNTSLSGQTGTGNFAGSNSPVFTTPNVGAANFTSLQAQVNGSHIYDDLGSPCLAINDAGSTSVNSWKMYGGPTGTGPHLQAFGSDTNVSANLLTQGTGGFNIQGIGTNTGAAAGFVGEIIQSVILNASAVSYSNATPKDLTSISLTAGDWDVYGNISFSGTTLTSSQVWISTTSATFPDASVINDFISPTSTITNFGISAPFVSLQLSTTTTVYISGSVGGTGTLQGRGGIYARRRR